MHKHGAIRNTDIELSYSYLIVKIIMNRQNRKGGDPV